MKHYILANKHKLIRWFKLEIIAGVIISVVFVYLQCGGFHCFYGIRFLLGIVISSIFVPAYCIFCVTLKGFVLYKRSRKLFNSDALEIFHRNGFQEKWKGQESKWSLGQLCFAGQYEGYNMTCEIDGGSLIITAISNYDHTDDWNYDEVKSVFRKFKHLKSFFDVSGVSTRLKTSPIDRMRTDFTNHLGEFILLLKALKINPDTIQINDTADHTRGAAGYR